MEWMCGGMSGRGVCMSDVTGGSRHGKRG